MKRRKDSDLKYVVLYFPGRPAANRFLLRKKEVVEKMSSNARVRMSPVAQEDRFFPFKNSCCQDEATDKEFHIFCEAGK